MFHILFGFEAFLGQFQDWLRLIIYGIVPVLLFFPPRKGWRPILLFLGRAIAGICALELIEAVVIWFFNNIFGWFFIFYDLMISLALYDFAAGLLSRRPSLRHMLIKVLTLLTASLSVTTLSFSFGNLLDDVMPGWTLVVYCAVTSLTILCLFIMRIHSLDKIPVLLRGITIFPAVLDLLVIVALILVLNLNFSSQPSREYTSIIFLLLYILVLVTYISSWMISRESYQLQRAAAEQKMQEVLINQLEMTRENMKTLRKIRHDLKNQYSYMTVLLQNKEYEKLEEVLNEYSQRKLQTEGYVDCGNVEVSAILTMEATKALAYDIHLNPLIVVPPKLPFSNTVLLSILSNMIDNAIESNLRYGLTDDIRIQMSLRNDYLYIATFNRLPEGIDTNELLQMKSTKNNRTDHGLGVQIIKEAAAMAGGDVVFDIQNDEFIVEVMLDMLKEESK